MPRRPVLVYDGDCAVCTRCAELVESRLRPDAEIVAFQDADLAGHGLTAHECELALQWVAADGRVFAAHEAVREVLQASGGIWRVPAALIAVPPLSILAAVVYRVVAANRHRLPGGTAACSLPPTQRPGARGDNLTSR